MLIPSGAGASSAPRTAPSKSHPVAGGRYLAWAQKRPGSTTVSDVYARRLGGRPFRVNPRGTEGVPGAISGARLVLEVTSGDDRTAVRLFDLRRRRMLKTPRGINRRGTDALQPSLSGDWLAFVRSSGVVGSGVLVLRNLRTHEQRQLGRADGWPHINGEWVVWPDHNEVAVYRLSDGWKWRVFDPFGMRWFYAPSVNSAGTVYYGERSRAKVCGDAQILAGSSNSTVVLVQFGHRFDVADTYAATTPTGTRVYYTRVDCRNGRTTISSVADRTP